MRPIIKSLLLYLLIIGLITANLFLVSDYPVSVYVIYIFLTLFVSCCGGSIFLGGRFAPGFFLGVALIGAVFSLELLAGWVRVDGIDFNPDILTSLIIFQLLVAAGEELSFRGYILKNLIEETGIKKGIIVSSFMFAAIHLPSFTYYGLDIPGKALAFTVVGLLGAIASIVYLEYGLSSAISFHFSWNFLQYSIFSLSKTQEGIMEISYTEPNFLTGGNYGPEAGALGLIVVGFALMLLINKYAKI